MRLALALVGAALAASCGAKSSRLFASEGASTNAAAAVVAAPSAVVEQVSQLPAGVYHTDPSHSSLTFSVDHLGFSQYVAAFTRFEAELQLDPAKPDEAKLVAKVDIPSLSLPSPPDGFHAELIGPNWLNAPAQATITYVSTRIARTGPETAKITGDLTLNGKTRPVVLEARVNGGWKGIPPDPHARIGFSAHGVVKRSDFGISTGIPTPPSKMGVSDDVDVRIETELTGPALTPPAEG